MSQSSRTLLATVVCLSTACASSPSASSSTPSPNPSATGASASVAPAKTWQGNLTATGATNSRLSGTISLTPVDGGNFSVTIDFRGGPNGKQLPWAIRPGGCGDMTPNSDIGGRGAYSLISTGADGQAHVNARLRVALPSDQTMHVDIMNSNSQRDVIIACGLLTGR
jgi:hypothetical protein